MDMTSYFMAKATAGENGGGTGLSIQADYLQNDPAAKDYIKNRPFYSEGEKTEIVVDREIIPLQEVEFSAENAPEGCLIALCTTSTVSAPAILSKSLNLTIDGTTYSVSTTRIGKGSAFGNLGLIGEGEATSDPFVGMIGLNDEGAVEFVIAYQTTETTHTIGLSYVGDTAPIIEEGIYPFENINGAIQHRFTNLWEACVEVDGVYNLTFDSEVYEGLSWLYHDNSGCFYLGNLSIANMGDDTEEKYILFRVVEDDGSVMLSMGTSYEAGDYTVSLEKVLPTTTVTTEVLHKIDPKFIPTPDYAQNDPKGEGYIKNRPFYGQIEKKIVEIPPSQAEMNILNSTIGLVAGEKYLFFSEEPTNLHDSDAFCEVQAETMSLEDAGIEGEINVIEFYEDDLQIIIYDKITIDADGNMEIGEGALYIVKVEDTPLNAPIWIKELFD